MSRSWKKRPAGGLTTSKSEKKWKQDYNRRLRHINKMRLHADKEPLLLDEVEDLWGGPKDGHIWHGEDICSKYPKIVRK
jgi:hypothetical protein